MLGASGATRDLENGMADLPVDIVDLLAHWERERPDAEAVRHGDQAWTWPQWARRVRRNAGAQRAAGLRPGDRIAVLDKNDPSGVETALGAALAGTSAAVVNFRLAAEEIAYVLNDSTARLVLVGAEFVPVLESVRDRLPAVERVIVVGGEHDEYEAWLAAAEPLTEPEPATPDTDFLQLYTSGTTGFPKGAMLTHGGLLAHSLAGASNFDLTADSAAMVAMPLFHVGGMSWAISALYHGARIVVVREINPPALLTELVEQRITHTFFVPAVFAFLLQVPDVATRDYSAMQVFVYGAAPMPLPLLRACLAAFPCDFQQVYGMTEASGAVTALGPAEHRDTAHEERLVSAGKPLDGVRIAIVDPVDGHRLSPDETGEVWLRTDQVMAGYWGRPEDTANALTADGWLRTGDAGRLDTDGYLYIEDRLKDMIISGGENIYPAEVERVLVEHPSVAEVAVIGVPDERWGEVGKAVVVPAEGAEVDEATLLAYCRERLASFKCPRTVEVVATLPRNPTGKVLKRELRAPYWPAKG
jgi:acyl-CoA synthetase (AMP-forming)/AMP-acid ligase II